MHAGHFVRKSEFKYIGGQKKKLKIDHLETLDWELQIIIRDLGYEDDYVVYNKP